MNQLVRRTVADVLGVDVDAITAGTSPGEVEAWDSARHIELVLALEEALRIRFEPDEISTMESVAAIEAIVARKVSS